MNRYSQFAPRVPVSDQAKEMWRQGLDTIEIAKTLREQGHVIAESMVARIVCPKGDRV